MLHTKVPFLKSTNSAGIEYFLSWQEESGEMLCNLTKNTRTCTHAHTHESHFMLEQRNFACHLVSLRGVVYMEMAVRLFGVLD